MSAYATELYFHEIRPKRAASVIRIWGAADRAKRLRTGLPLGSFVSDGEIIDKEIFSLVRQFAGHGLLEYRLGRSGNGEDQVVIEPQMPDYWPRTPQLDNADTLVLSRFAYMRRRGNAMVLESPRAGALFKICRAEIATALAMLSAPKQIKHLRRQDAFPGVELLALLVDCQIPVSYTHLTLPTN